LCRYKNSCVWKSIHQSCHLGFKPLSEDIVAQSGAQKNDRVIWTNSIWEPLICRESCILLLLMKVSTGLKLGATRWPVQPMIIEMGAFSCRMTENCRVEWSRLLLGWSDIRWRTRVRFWTSLPVKRNDFEANITSSVTVRGVWIRPGRRWFIWIPIRILSNCDSVMDEI